MMLGALGIAAAILQVAGYWLYLRNFVKERIRPNAASFLMFSYGTWLLVFLEWRNGADWPVLALPITCAAMGVVVALMCLREGATDPVDRVEAIAFSADLWLTLIYAWFALGLGDASGIAVPLLIVGNITTVTCFIPMLRSTWLSPHRERPGPWVIWTCAYGLLILVTLAAGGLSKPVLLLYPVLSFLLHGAIAAMLVRNTRGELMFGFGRNWYLDHSRIEGLGVFAARSFAAGDPIVTLRGELKRGYHAPDHGPNWIGIGPNAWMDPARPLNAINHSCKCNAAFGRKRVLYAVRDIAAGEEVTIDYSTTECDPSWHMTCDCRTTNCRQGLFAIQFSFRDAAEAPLATPLMQRIWAKRRIKSTDTPAFGQFGDNIARLPVPRKRTRKVELPMRVANER
jgi:hypothetical protein